MGQNWLREAFCIPCDIPNAVLNCILMLAIENRNMEGSIVLTYVDSGHVFELDIPHA